jgi:hypothetical protein
LNSNPRTLFYCGVTTRATTVRERPETSGRESLPRTTKAKLAPSRRPDHRQGDTAHKDPEVLLAAELGPRACTLRERYPGTCASAPRQKGARTGRRFRRRQLGGDKPASASKPGAAHQVLVSRRHACQTWLYTARRNIVFHRILLRRFLEQSRKGTREKTR